mmetsp:Transcript_46155/g.70589  ORF Transcript_46155/g.70589 Transcript_46155/m.70589 type:complete len:1732 (-) Transcript_46155:57-5252(-)|eukprot:CAMPEP_0117032930 /NCGR_PEP_ID=MMETSP0472-20121206/23570_1 /TAXON_ID=693140 ORGANISM="Tiarina fusus, Strain LIS" /NCGR_SAMPLE_ID=MMETSP0472 /ASSEMBLY_ACC=CAM_ASM_000603 /LENGTH=1731 /DNA_ID=CAMNT_0004741711 /DNA_START=139 /DNA_END=5334 /DNA_ORIENTATION=+
MASPPIIFSEALNLQQLGVPEGSIKHGMTAMESDKWIVCVEPTQVTMVDLRNGAQVTRRPIQAEAAIMNPEQNILALRSGTTLQIFNLDAKSKLKSHNMPEPIVFWKWTSPTNLALVTGTSVYHWALEGAGAPVKVFDRHPTLGPNTQIINYRVSPDNKWCVLGGISAGAGGVVNGNMQLFNIERKLSQPLQGHAAAFATIKIRGRDDPAQILVFHEKKAEAPGEPPKFHIKEIGRDPSKGPPHAVAPVPIPVPADGAADFPVSLAVDPKNELAFLLTKMGYTYMFDCHSGKVMYRQRVTQETVFVTCPQPSTGAIFGITVRRGSVLRIQLNAQAVVPYIVQTLRDTQLALQIAGRLNLPGAENLFAAEFERLISSGQVAEAAKVVAASGNALRTPATIARFQQMPAEPNAVPPVLQYFSTLLESGRLNEQESIEVAKPVLQQRRLPLMEKWLKDDKLQASEALGDLIMPHDVGMALSVYLRAEVHGKAIQCFVQRGEYDKIVPYSTSVGFKMDYSNMLSQLLFNNPQGALDLAKGLVSADGGPLIDIQQTAEAFLSSNRIQETTAFLLEALKDNKQEHAYLQTKLLEINLIGGAPQVADAIMQQGLLTHYDRPHIAKLCERAGMWQRAAEHFTDIADIKRVFKNSHQMSSEFVVSFFGTLNREQSISLLKDMMSKGPQNMQVCVEVAKKYHEELGSGALVEVFEQNRATEGLYYYLGAIVNFSEDSFVHFKYIQSSCMLGQFKEAERVCRDSNIYDPEEVKAYLKGAKLPDPRPLIHVCDRFDFVDELTEYLYLNSLLQYIEVYVTKVSPTKTPQVVGKLFDLGANEDFIKRILMAVGTACPVDELVEIAETRNRLRLLQPWLEARVATGSTEPPTHNALGKIYITLNRDPKSFLLNNMFYEPKVLGPYCESLDPQLAFIAYKKGAGECDDDLIKISQTHGLYRDLAQYLVERQDMELWAKVLTKEEGDDKESSRRQLIDQIVEWALPESTSADEVSCTVKAFMAADMPGELISLLERIVLQGSDFSDNKNLQNLLILTAIRADTTRVAGYIDQLDNFDAKDIALICVSDTHNLFEEGFSIYTKFSKPEFTQDKDDQIEMQVLAIGVLVDFMKDLDRAKTYATQCDEKPVWSKLGKAQLDGKFPADAIESFINAEDASEYVKVCAESNEAEIWAELIPYLKMARKSMQENLIDTELIYAYAKTNNLTELEQFVSGPNVANIQSIGDRCFSEGLYHAAKLLFISINNNSKLALCHIHLEEYREAVAAAQKANNVSTWKHVCFACLRADEFRLASTCGLEVIKYPDHVDEVVSYYSDLGHFTHLVSLFEQGLGLDDAHIGIFTELGVLYTKHVPEKIMEHCKVFFSKLNVSKVVRACERARLWDPAVYLYMHDKQHDSALKIMMERANSWDNDLFLDSVTKVRNNELMYKAVSYYLTMHPELFTRLMEVMEENIDHSRVVSQLRRTGDWALQLGQTYLKSVQKFNLSPVNEALNELFVEDEDYEALRKSIDSFNNFNMIALASKLATHELLEFRRISAYVYRCNKKWSQSIDLSKNDRMWKDCIDTANESEDPEIIENLLRFFCDSSEKECFAAALYTCFSHVNPDVVLELGWLNGYHHYIMPFFIQTFRRTHKRLADLEKRTEVKQEDEAQQDAIAGTYGNLSGFGGVLMLENGGGMGGMPAPQGGIDMSGFGVGGMPQGMPPQGMPQGMGMMPNGGMPNGGMPQMGGMGM